ncbi:MAG: hypothetical protein F4103_11490 [Boseongicola sp. SB0673_bin_14]|nr:hypothetical protein [Boseongicola sp. SB0673_bin_14]
MVEKDGPALDYFVQEVDGWSDETNARLRKQFMDLDLGRRYGIEATELIAGQRKKLQVIFESRGRDGVREDLHLSAGSWKVHNRNCWQAAGLEALGNSDWYCGGGFSMDM